MTSLLISMLLGFNAFGDKVAPPTSMAAFSENRKFVYVYWLNNRPILSDEKISTQKFPKSGLYNYSAQKFKWALDHSKLDMRFHAQPLNDGEHLLVYGPWARSIEDDAFTLYRKKRLIKNFKIKDFCSDTTKFSYTVSHFFWHQNFKIQNSDLTVRFESCGKKFVVDIKTGKIHP